MLAYLAFSLIFRDMGEALHGIIGAKDTDLFTCCIITLGKRWAWGGRGRLLKLDFCAWTIPRICS
jgi:hypothetical protein